jgi:hypothetical protein
LCDPFPPLLLGRTLPPPVMAGLRSIVGGEIHEYTQMLEEARRHATLWLLIVGGLITIGTLLECVIYKPLLRERPGAGWVKTAERFIDPDTGQPVDVFYNPASGERQYVSQEPQKKA